MLKLKMGPQRCRVEGAADGARPAGSRATGQMPLAAWEILSDASVLRTARVEFSPQECSSARRESQRGTMFASSTRVRAPRTAVRACTTQATEPSGFPVAEAGLALLRRRHG